MIKKYCDHCGKEIRGKEAFELDITETFYDFKKFKSIGVGSTLCRDCYDLRRQKHAELDEEFLNIYEKSEPEIEVWFCKSCGRTVRKNPIDGPSAWCPKCWKPYTIQYRKADYFDGSKKLSES